MNSSKNNKHGGYWNQTAPCTEEEVGRLMLENIKLLLQKKDSDVEPENNNNTKLRNIGQRPPAPSPQQLPSPPQHAPAPLPVSPRQAARTSPRTSPQQQPPFAPAQASLALSSSQQASQAASAPLTSQVPPQQQQQQLALQQQQQSSQAPPPASQAPASAPQESPPALSDVQIIDKLKSALKKIQGLNLQPQQLQTSIENVSTALAALSDKSSKQYEQVLQGISEIRQNLRE
jgi:hypothetical protein